MSYRDYANSQPFVNADSPQGSGYLFDAFANEAEQAGDLTVFKVSGSLNEGGLQANLDFSSRVIAPLVNFLQSKLGGLPIWLYLTIGGVGLIILMKRRRP